MLYYIYMYCLFDKMYETIFGKGGTNITRSSFSIVSLHRESLLHLALRWGLAKLSHFLLCLPGGAQALMTPNEEGATPLDLASHGGHSKLVDDITR